MSIPAQKPGKSKQDYETPVDLMEAVVNRFGRISFDLAASIRNAKAAHFFSELDNSLSQDWTKISGNKWLNPPFENIKRWAAKANDYRSKIAPDGQQRLLLLTPASVGSNWFHDHVYGRAFVLALNPRLTFIGAEDPYPKDCMLSVFGLRPGFRVWKWK